MSSPDQIVAAAVQAGKISPWRAEAWARRIRAGGDRAAAQLAVFIRVDGRVA
ncbi:MAG: hypothetical protein WBF34_16985 [Streptosporangiaceae bacterium]